MVYFAHWLTDERSRKEIHDCTRCVRNKYNTNRICFRPEHGGVERHNIEFPDISEEGEKLGGVVREADTAEVFAFLAEKEALPLRGIPVGTSVFNVFKNLLMRQPDRREICPTGLAVDMELGQILNHVLLCKEYHCLPEAGGLGDQPMWFVQAMQVIGEAEAQFTNDSLDMQRKSVGK